MRLVGLFFLGYAVLFFWGSFERSAAVHKCWEVHGMDFSCRGGLTHYDEFEAQERAKWKPGFGPNK